MTLSELWRDRRVLLTGGAGFLGGHVHRHLKGLPVRDVRIPRSATHDLRRREVCEALVDEADIVIHLAATVGGIGFNRAHPGELVYDNLAMGMHLLEAARHADVEHVVIASTICAYPATPPLPFSEDHLWDGYPEPTNAPYGLAKKMLLVQAQAYRQQYGTRVSYLLLSNLYGPGDCFDPHRSHVIPALIRRFVDAREQGVDEVVVWGTGAPSRDFLHVDDAARALLLAGAHHDDPAPLNIGTGREVTIRALVDEIAAACRYRGRIRWDPSQPDGQSRRCVDASRAATALGWAPSHTLRDGLAETVQWWEAQR